MCSQVRSLKQQNNALADEASNAKFKLVDAQQEQLKLKGQIVEVAGTSFASESMTQYLCFCVCKLRTAHALEGWARRSVDLSMLQAANGMLLDNCLSPRASAAKPLC